MKEQIVRHSHHDTYLSLAGPRPRGRTPGLNTWLKGRISLKDVRGRGRATVGVHDDCNFTKLS